MGAIVDPATIQYNDDDPYKFPVCFFCVRWSPFLIYLEDNPGAKKYRPLPNGLQLYCPRCVPHPDHFRQRFPGEKIYRDESILNDQKLMQLLREFRYEHPRKDGFIQLDRIIITERTRLREPYKTLAKKPLPKMRKLEKLMDLFPPWHRMANNEFAGFRAMRSAVRRRVAQIEESYMNLSESEHSQMQDNIDAMVDRTPMHARMMFQQRLQRELMPPPPPIAPPIVEDPPPVANLTVSSLGDVSVSSADSTMSGDPLRTYHSSEDEPSLSQDTHGGVPRLSGIPFSSQSGVLSSQSVQLSSQDVSGPIGASGLSLNTPPPVGGASSLLVLSTSPSSSDSSVKSTAGQASPTSVVAAKGHRKRSLLESNSEEEDEEEEQRRSLSVASVPVARTPPTPNDGQVAGPSHKRQRNELPVNPTPADFVKNPGCRMPRLKGA